MAKIIKNKTGDYTVKFSVIDRIKILIRKTQKKKILFKQIFRTDKK